MRIFLDITNKRLLLRETEPIKIKKSKTKIEVEKTIPTQNKISNPIPELDLFS